jgi:hypothetical protein
MNNSITTGKIKVGSPGTETTTIIKMDQEVAGSKP